MNEINRFLEEYFSDDRLKYLIPFEVNTDESVTIQPLKGDAFSLSAASGYTKGIIAGPTISNGAIVRAIIPYMQVARMKDNSTLRLFYFSILLNSMLASATKTIGTLNTRNITIKRPGFGNADFLRELENTAGYEFRLYIYPSEAANVSNL